MASERSAKRARVEDEGSEMVAEVGRGWLDGCHVRPLGNKLVGDGAVPVNKASGLGALQALDDLTLLHVLKCLRPVDLCRVACVSKALYVLGSWDPLFKPHVLRCCARDFRFGHGWKETYARCVCSRVVSREVSFSEVYYSDQLYRERLLSRIQADDPAWHAVCNVDRRSNLTVEEFKKEYEHASLPVVITDIVPSWPAAQAWTRESLLRRFPEAQFKVSGHEMKLGDFFQYSERNEDQRPLYLFDSAFTTRCPEMADEYTLPDYFKDDFFRLLADSSSGIPRPDHRWLIIGPAGSGSSFHVDPNGTCAFNAVISGRKKWILYPPGTLPPGVVPDADGGFSTPSALGAWLLDHHEAVSQMPEDERPYECVCHPGDLMVVPSGWWHCVINLDESIAITHNVITEYNLLSAIDLLREPARCAPGKCSGDVMGDVPLWVAMGGSSTVPNAEIPSGVGCACDRLKNTLLQRLQNGIERERPGLIAQLRSDQEAAAERASTLWDKLTTTSSDAPFSFGF